MFALLVLYLELHALLAPLPVTQHDVVGQVFELLLVLAAAGADELDALSGHTV